jgi:hypothetical protein
MGMEMGKLVAIGFMLGLEGMLRSWKVRGLITD